MIRTLGPASRLASGLAARLRSAALLGLLGAVASSCAPPALPAVPEQPIAFSHASHIEAGLECARCHPGAERAKAAGLTPLRTCAVCHRRTATDNPEVQKVMAAWGEERAIEWKKVNVIPESAMVHFRHAPHARAGVECQECHGDVASMGVALPVLNVANMGWCIDCHRERGASDDCLACHY